MQIRDVFGYKLMKCSKIQMPPLGAAAISFFFQMPPLGTAAISFFFKGHRSGLRLLPDSFAAISDDGITHHFC